MFVVRVVVVERGGGSGGGASSKDELRLSGHLLPNRLQGMRIGGGMEPIVYNRELMRDDRLSDELVERVERATGRMAA